MGVGEHIFPLTPIWWSSSEFCWMFVYVALGSSSYTYYKFGKMLFSISKNEKLKINLFNHDDFAGLKKISDFLFWITGSILILVGFFIFSWYIILKFTHAPPEFIRQVIVFVSFVDIITLSIFFIPLLGMRNLIRDRKREEKQVLLSKIEEIEKSLMHKLSEKKSFFTSLEKMHYAISVLDKIDSVNEWPFSSRMKIELGAKIAFTFNTIIIENVIKYLIK